MEREPSLCDEGRDRSVAFCRIGAAGETAAPQDAGGETAHPPVLVGEYHDLAIESCDEITANAVCILPAHNNIQFGDCLAS